MIHIFAFIQILYMLELADVQHFSDYFYWVFFLFDCWLIKKQLLFLALMQFVISKLPEIIK